MQLKRQCGKIVAFFNSFYMFAFLMDSGTPHCKFLRLVHKMIFEPVKEKKVKKKNVKKEKEKIRKHFDVDLSPHCFRGR